MIHRDDGASPWTQLDLTGVGMTPPDPRTNEETQGRDWLLFAAAAHRGEAFLRWSQLTAVAEFLEITLGRLADLIDGGEDQRDLFDPWTVTIEEVAIVFALPAFQAKALAGEAVAATDRLPSTAALLRDGVIDPAVFTTVVDRTDIVDDRETLHTIDHSLARSLSEAGHISVTAASRIADRIVETHDTDAVKRRYEKKNRKKNVTHRDYPDGLGGLHVTADAEETRLAQEAVNVLAAACCPNDPRTIGQRRSAAAIARLRRLPFTCACAAKEACTAELDEQQISQRQAAIVIHAVCQKSTLAGENALPAHLDGHGPIRAAHVRELAQRPDAIVRDLDLDDLHTSLDHTIPDCDTTGRTTRERDTSAGRDAATGSHTTRDHSTEYDNTGDGSTTEHTDTAEEHAAPGRDNAVGDDPRPTVGTIPAEGHGADAEEAAEGEPEEVATSPSSASGTSASATDTGLSTPRRHRLFPEHPAAPEHLTTLEHLATPGRLMRIDNTSRAADPYRPTATLDALVRALFGTCTLPGCEHPAWSCHLDHIAEFDHRCPASGGPTCLCNLAPKCLKHHLLKTHLGATNPAKGWVDDLWIDPDDGTPRTSITVHGITVDTRAPNRWLLPQLKHLRCGHHRMPEPENRRESGREPNHPSSPDDPRPPAGGGIQAVTAYKHAWRRAARARLRRARAHADRDLGPPPF
ncbi:MAG: DUF222 domain-containing protein [Gordonia sp. (in: high G+C Gram-positive bacteria)]|uniref:DUF222 domain-containing protein n=1 Tax=Gordonia sp. (in: high G+C Gram-positive bacteria) TaxID=84139 RepID=UPI0039E54961